MEPNPIKSILKIFTSRIFIAAGTALVLLSFILLLFLERKELNRNLSQAKEMSQRFQEEMQRGQKEKEQLLKEKERIQADSISCLGASTKLQMEMDKLASNLLEAGKKITEDEIELKRLKSEHEKPGRKTPVKELPCEQAKLRKEKEILQNKVDALTLTLKQERAKCHYNLGVLYTQSNLYDDAIREFLESLSFDTDNPDAHYNLGFLYNNIKEDKLKAEVHFKKYLKLKPDAADKEEVESWVGKQ